MGMKLISGKELVELAPLDFEINEVTLEDETVWQLNDLAFGPVIYESQKPEKEPFTERILLVKSDTLIDGSTGYQISAVIL